MFLLFPRYFKGNKYLNNCCKAFYSMLKIFIFVTFSEVRFNFFFQGSGGKHLPGPATPRGRGCHASLLLSPTFLRSKKKKGKLREKKRFSKQKLLKTCHQGQNVTVLAILECIELKKFSCRPTMVAANTFQCSMAPSTLKSISPVLTSEGKTLKNVCKNLKKRSYIFKYYDLLNDIFFLNVEEEKSPIIPSCIISEKTIKTLN